MTEEEKAIHMLKSYAGMSHKMTDNQGRPKLDQAIEIVLNLIQKQNKVINEMAELIEECRQNDVIYSEEIDLSEIAGTDRIKEYFIKKAEDK